MHQPTVVHDLVPDCAVRDTTPVPAGLVESLYVMTLLLGVLTGALHLAAAPTMITAMTDACAAASLAAVVHQGVRAGLA